MCINSRIPDCETIRKKPIHEKIPRKRSLKNNAYFRWFSGHLNASLEYRDWEPGMGGGAKPESEIWMGRLVL